MKRCKYAVLSMYYTAKFTHLEEAVAYSKDLSTRNKDQLVTVSFSYIRLHTFKNGVEHESEILVDVA